MLLYIHVPFCRTKCAYCAFYSLTLPRGKAGEDLQVAYREILLQELAFWGQRIGPQPISSVFFGGGTPSLLPPEFFRQVLEEIRNWFALAPDAEVTIEANPESALAPGWLLGVRQAGATRLSLGFQSLDDVTLTSMGRLHSAQEAEMAFRQARKAGFSSINVDLIWGAALPDRGQGRHDWLRTLGQVAMLGPEHISAYSLILEEGSPITAQCIKGQLILPTEDELVTMYSDGVAYLATQGYQQYEISNFCKPGFACKHNTGYWTGEEYLGLGPAATSTRGKVRWTNPADFVAWQELVAAGDGGRRELERYEVEYEVLDRLTRAKETLMLRLRMTEGLPLYLWEELRGEPFLAEFSSQVQALEEQSLVEVVDGHFRLTSSGILVSNSILEYLFQYI